MTTTNKKPRLNANAAYENAHLVAQDLLERINELLHDLPAPDCEGHPVHWGYVGTVNHINELLSQAIESLESAI